MTERSRLDRRPFLTRQQPRRGRGPSPDYGPLQPAIAGLPLLMLPADFRYRSFGWTGEAMTDGLVTPGVHDGMAAFPAGLAAFT